MEKPAAVWEPGGKFVIAHAAYIDGAGLPADAFSDIYAVSAAAAQAALFMSGRNRETLDLLANRLNGSEVFSFVYNILWRWRHPFDLDTAIDAAFNAIDLDAFEKNPTRLHIGILGLDGETRFVRATRGNLRTLIMATCSVFPFARPVEFEGRPYVDLGILNPLPVDEALRRGHKRIVVFLNKTSDFRVLTSPWWHAFLLYPRHPALRRAFHRRARKHTKAMQHIQNPPRGVQVDYLAPLAPLPISRHERLGERLLQAYETCYEIGKKSRRLFHNEKS